MKAHSKTNHSETINQTPDINFPRNVSRRTSNALAPITEEIIAYLIGKTDQTYAEALAWKPAKDADSLHATTMYECAAQLQQLLVTWVLVADDRHAQIYECHKATHKMPSGDIKSEHKLISLPNGTVDAATMADDQAGSGWPGEASNNHVAHDIFEPYRNVREELKRRFTGMIASKLERACVKNSFDRLVLVAPTKLIGELKGQLVAEVRDRIVGVLPNHLVYYQNQAAMTHTDEVLKEAFAG